MQTSHRLKGDGHNISAPGFSQTADPFAILDRRGQIDDDDDGLYFDDTYDGLGEQLEEAGDAFNDDTFGSEPATQDSVGKNFDFSGQTAKVAGAIQEEHVVYNVGRSAKATSFAMREKPVKSGYEKYTEPAHIPQLEANASLWGITKKPSSESKADKRLSGHAGAAGKKVMSLEEVEAAMRANRKNPAKSEQSEQRANMSVDTAILDGSKRTVVPYLTQGMQPNWQTARDERQMVDPYETMLQRSRNTPSAQGVPISQALHDQQISQFGQQASVLNAPQKALQQPSLYNQPYHVMQNRSRHSGHGQANISSSQEGSVQQIPDAPHRRGPSIHGQLQIDPKMLGNMTEEERQAFLMEETRRAKRNHKIFLLSKDNGLMTPYDKNFISRIQLQQLVTATGNVNDSGTDSALSEDFYYQVYSQIRNAHRQTPNQPLNQFAQTYLFQNGNRHNATAKRLSRVGDTHMQRMEQQIQRAVEVAKLRPKNKQLVIEGSLGKISFSNAKTPKPLLNIKRAEGSEPRPSLGRTATTKSDRKVALRDIENVYDTLMSIEDQERKRPISNYKHSNPESVQHIEEWDKALQSLKAKLWHELKVMAPIVSNSPTAHPFIAILSHAKGKKAIPRIFRHLNGEQRLRILTLTVLHLNTLDVIQRAIPQPDEPSLPRHVRESVELFSQIVLPPLLTPVTDEPISIVIGLLGLLLDRAQAGLVLRSKVGLGILTMLISRAELAKQSRTGSNSAAASDKHSGTNGTNPGAWEQQWSQLYDRLFNQAEPFLPVIFPGKATETDDVHVWQFLATMAVGASPEQQQRLVIGVKDRIMETVAVSKTLPPEMASARLGHVNLFMRAIGLDVELLG